MGTIHLVSGKKNSEDQDKMTTALCNNIRCGRVMRGATGRSRSVVVRCSGAPVAPPVLSKEILYANLGVAYEDLRRAPPSEVSD